MSNKGTVNNFSKFYLLEIQASGYTAYSIRTCFVYGGGVMPGWWAGSSVGKYMIESPK